MSEEQTTEQPVEAAASAQLQLADLLVCVQLIQLASTRGAFKAEEFTQIGAVYDRLVVFLRDSGAIQPAAPSEPAAPAEAE
jgi:hypothetical protein